MTNPLPFIKVNQKFNADQYGNNYPDESAVWNSFREGNESAFIYIYQTYFDKLYAYGCRFCNHEDQVKDSIQDLFIYLRKHRGSLGVTDSIKFYLFKAIKRRIIKEENKWYNKLEELGNHTHFDFVFSHEQHLIEKQIDEDTHTKLNEAIKRLSPRKKEVIYYFYFEGMSYPQIQEIMGLENIKSARNLLYQALDFLRDALQSK
jgi:RNA polymerase sigma factor (sigma-70 family)